MHSCLVAYRLFFVTSMNLYKTLRVLMMFCFAVWSYRVFLFSQYIAVRMLVLSKLNLALSNRLSFLIARDRFGK